MNRNPQCPAIARVSLLDAYLILSALSLPLGLLRLLAIFETGHLFIAMDTLYALGVILLCIRSGAKIFRPTLETNILLLICGIAGFVGALNGYPLAKICIDIFKPIVFYSTYLCLRSVSPKFIESHAPTTKVAAFFFFTATLTIGTGFALRMLGHDFYLSLTEVTYLFPIAILWAGSRRIQSMGLTGLLLIGGRRGALVALLAALVPFGFRASLVRMRNTRILPAFLVGAGLMFIPEMQDALLSLGTVAKFTESIAMARSQTVSNSWLEIAAWAFDDRIREVTSVLRDMNRSWTNILFGMGAGYTYFVESKYHDLDVAWLRGVHFSPIGIYVYYGILGFLFTYGFLIRGLFSCWNIMTRSKNRMALACAFFAVGDILNSFTAYSIFSSPLLAVCLGIVANFSDQKTGDDALGYKAAI